MDFMDGSLGIREPDGLTANPESPVVDKKVKKENLIQLAVQLKRCAIQERNTKNHLKEFLGKKATRKVERFTRDPSGKTPTAMRNVGSIYRIIPNFIYELRGVDAFSLW
jgi:hypothetical protein